MTTLSDPTSAADADERRRRLADKAWPSLAIAVMWVAVFLDALFGPDMVFSNAGMNTTTIPSAVVLALFAYLGTRVVARYGFGDRDDRE